MIQTVEVLTDDLDPRITTHKQTTTTVETVRFQLDGTNYEIHLSPKHAAELRACYSAYIAAGRQAAPKASTRTSRTRAASRANGSSHPNGSGSKPGNEVVRAWAKSKHLPVKDRGRIAAEITAQYVSEHR